MTQQRDAPADRVDVAAKGIGAGLLAIVVALCRQCDDVARIGFHHADDVGRGALSQVDDIGRNSFSSSDDLLRSADDLMPESNLHRISWEDAQGETVVPAVDQASDEGERLMRPLLRESVERTAEALMTPAEDSEE